MPAKTTMFNLRANPTYNFPLGPRNTISFSPNSRFVLVAGFGNLAGQMDIYDLERDHQKLCTIQGSNAIVCDWSPDGKYILTATTSPRLRVDNGVRIWHVGGSLLYNEDLLELYHVAWRPNRDATQTIGDLLHPVPPPHQSALEYLGTVKTPSKPAGAYRPPGARGQVTPIAFRREDEGGAAYTSAGSLSTGVSAISFGKPRRRDVPGAEVVPSASNAAQDDAAPGDHDDSLTKAAAKNKKKREAKKAKGAEAKVVGLVPNVDKSAEDQSSSASRSPEGRKRQGSQERHKSQVKDTGSTQSSRPQPQGQSTSGNTGRGTQRISKNPASATPAAMNGTSRPPAAPPQADPPVFDISSPGGGGSSQDKKIRALLKKLRAIDDLKMRRAGGEKLEGTQIKKMGTENDVRKELEELGWNE